MNPCTPNLALDVYPILDYLESQLPGYPFDPELDTPFVQELVEDFEYLDILEEIKILRWYSDNEPLSSASKPRVALRRWLTRAKRRVTRSFVAP